MAKEKAVGKNSLFEEAKKIDTTSLRKEQITAAAYKIVSDKGYYKFTIQDIAKEAGLSAGLIPYYFKNKQGLLLELFRETQKRVRENLIRELDKTEDPLEKLRIFIDESFLLFEREKNYFYLLFEFWTQIKRDERIRKRVQRLYQSYRVELAAIIEQGIEKGVFIGMDVQYMTTLCVSIVQHTIIQHLIDDKAFDFKDYSKRIKRFILELIVKDGYL